MTDVGKMYGGALYELTAEEGCEEEKVPTPASLPENSEPVALFSGESDEIGFVLGSDEYEKGNSAVVPLEPKSMCMKKFSLQFAGVIDVNMIANSLKLIIGDKAEGELEIICNLA